MVNIFVLDPDERKAAEYHFDIHLAKGILEIAWIFYTARHNLGLQDDGSYKKMRWINNGCVVWTQSSYQNYVKLYKIAEAINEEMKFRYDKSGEGSDHKSFSLMKQTFNSEVLIDIKSRFKSYDETPAYLAMPEIYHHENVHLAYKAYYFFHKRYRLPSISWTKRGIPDWYNMNFFDKNSFLPSNFSEF